MVYTNVLNDKFKREQNKKNTKVHFFLNIKISSFVL